MNFIFTLIIIHLFPKEILSSIVLSFSGDDCNTQEKTETMVVQLLIIILFASFVLFRFFFKGERVYWAKSFKNQQSIES